MPYASMNEIPKAERKRLNKLMGDRNELRYLPILTEMFGKLEKLSDEGELDLEEIDFYGENVIVELKSRLWYSNSFNETTFGYNKIKKAREEIKKNPNCKVYFVFGFIDGLYLWEFNEENYNINGGDVQKRIGQKNMDRKEQLYVFSKNLTKIDDRRAWIPNEYRIIAEERKPKIIRQTGICLLTPIKQKQCC